MRVGNAFSNIPPVTKNLLVINVLIWLVEFIFPSFGANGIYRYLGLHFWEGSQFNPLQLITYMFVHDRTNILHIFFNMFTLWTFGRILEQVWGGKKFLLFYMVCGVGAALIQEAVWGMTWQHDYIAGIAQLNGLTYDNMEQVVNAAVANHDASFLSAIEQVKNSMLTVGASGAIFGLLLGFAFVFPDMPLYLFFIPVPIKAKYMVIGYAVLEFFFGVSTSLSGTGTVAHFAHLGGMLFGLAMLLYWRSKGKLYGGKC
jgi:membrane associated rhomboid family serine protease